MKIVFDHVDGRDIMGAKSLTITAHGIYTNKEKIASFTLTDMGQLALISHGKLLGSISVEP